MNGPWSEPGLTGIGRLPMHSVAHDVRFPLDDRWSAVRELIVVEPAFVPRNPFGIAHVD